MLRKRMPQGKTLLAQQMREKPTAAEAALWPLLVEQRYSHNVKWRQQVPSLGFILDFYCAKRRMIVEVDGGYHNDRQAYDAFRDRVFIQRIGATVIRVTNDRVLASPKHIADQILAITLTRPILHPSRRLNLPKGAGRIFLT